MPAYKLLRLFLFCMQHVFEKYLCATFIYKEGALIDIKYWMKYK